MDRADAKATLERLFHAGVAAALPSAVVPEAALAAGVRPRAGLVVTRRGQGRPLRGMAVIEAAHPTPDETSVAAARRMLALADGASADDHVLMLLSGGASALLCLPGEGLTLAAKQAVTRALLRCGAPVQEINTVRRHLSAIKGGRLAAAAWPARVTTLAISDVVGDAPEAIGSGPTAADPTTLAQAKAILARYGVEDPGAGWSESPGPGDLRLTGSGCRIIASARQSLDAVRRAAAAEGFEPVSLGDDLEGEARDLGARHAGIARDHAGRRGRFALISGGELTVTMTGDGRGGPNFEYAAALALGMEGLAGVAALCGDSDGIDGNSGASGAFAFGDAAARARAAGRPLDRALAGSDTATAFAALGEVFAPGPTGTNVNDLRIILIDTA